MDVRMSDLIDLNLGFSYTMYKKAEVEIGHTSGYLRVASDVTEYYDKRTFIIAVGIDFLFGEN
ncbi:MAG: hypothetical protein RQ743_01260 [Bacteroidales bacterium]|nr:hypothetical protein [Bacteroidales bacterium]